MTILVAYVPRPEGRAAIEAGIDLARKLDEDLVVVNADPGGENMSDAFSDATDQEVLTQKLTASGVRHDVRQYIRGRTAVEELQELAESLPASLLIIGLRKRSPVGKLFLGSIAQELLLSLDCPVLAVKATSN